MASFTKLFNALFNMINLNQFINKILITFSLSTVILTGCSSDEAHRKSSNVIATNKTSVKNVPNQTKSSKGNSSKQVNNPATRQNNTKIHSNPLWIFLHNTALTSLNYSSEVKQTASTALSSKDEIDAVRGQRYPQVNVSASSPQLEVGRSNGDNQSARTQVSITTPVFDWGRISAQVEGQEYDFEASNLALRLKQDEIAYSILANAVEIARVKSLLSVTDVYVERMNQLVEMLSQIVQSDAGRGSELLQAQTKQIQAMTSRDALVSRLNELNQAAARLLGEEIQFPQGVEFKTDIFGQVDIETLIKNHPKILEANAQYKKALSSAKSINASRFPQLNLNITKNSTDLKYDDKDDPLLVGLNLSWAAFEGGSASASEKAAIQQAKTIYYQQQTTARDLLNTIQTASIQRDNAIMRTKQYSNLVDASQEVKQAFFDQWFNLGKKQLLDVLGAESDFYNNQQAIINLEYDAFNSQLRIYAESGLLLSWLNIQPISIIK